MIIIDVEKNESIYRKLNVHGHSMLADYGHDIVCAAVSALTIGIINGLTEVCHIKNLKIESQEGYISLEIPKNLTLSEKQIVKAFLDTLILSYEQIQEQYPAEIKINFKEIN